MSGNILDSFDADVWAREFVGLHGGDIDLMRAWFANALMRGYDEYRWRQSSAPPPAPAPEPSGMTRCLYVVNERHRCLLPHGHDGDHVTYLPPMQASGGCMFCARGERPHGYAGKQWHTSRASGDVLPCPTPWPDRDADQPNEGP